MTNNATIDGVSRELIERAISATISARGPGSPTERDLRALLDAPAAERKELLTSQVPVLRAMAANYRNGHSWDFLDGEAVNKAADEITRLQARIAELKSGSCKPVAVVLPDRLGSPESIKAVLDSIGRAGRVSYWDARDIWNACLDAVAAKLNIPK